MRKRRFTRRIVAEINMVPYIDVMLVLLVIFMIATPLMTEGVKVNLPNAQTKALKSDQLPVIVTVDRLGQYFISSSPTPQVPVTADQLVNLVAAEILVAQEKQQTLPVYVKADRDTGYGSVMTAMSLLQQAGVGTIGLLSRSMAQQMR